MTVSKRSAGITALSLFFIFGASMSGLAALMLLFPGSVLEPLWRINPRAHEGLTAMGSWALLLMTGVCLGCASAALGLWRCTRWGFWTALTILCVNLAGDTVNALMARDWHTLIGLPIGGFMLAYLLRHQHVFKR
jgi:hypothetical protein